MPICEKCGQIREVEDMDGKVCIFCRNIENFKLSDESVDNDRRMLARDRSANVSPATFDMAAVGVVLTTAIDIPGRETASIVDIVGAEVAVGMNIFKDIANAWRDTFGGRSNSVQNTLRDARAQCMLDLRREAFRLGADAVVAVRIFYSEATATGGSGGGILIVAATGTAVKLQ